MDDWLLSLAIFLLGLIGSILIVWSILPFGTYDVNVWLMVFGFILIIIAVVAAILLAIWEFFWD